MLLTQVFVYRKISQYWIAKKTFYFMLIQKTVFRSQIWSKNLEKKNKKLSKKCVFFYIKILLY